jgi:hypothetical protein
MLVLGRKAAELNITCNRQLKLGEHNEQNLNNLHIFLRSSCRLKRTPSIALDMIYFQLQLNFAGRPCSSSAGVTGIEWKSSSSACFVSCSGAFEWS